MQVDISNGAISVWSPAESARLFPTYHPQWNHPVGSRGNGTIWLLDPSIFRSDLDSCGVDHEDWIFPYLDMPAGSTALDLASFIGTNAVRWAKQGVNVIAVEPVPKNRDLLYRNLILNDVVDQVTVIPKAFGSHVGTARMRFDSAGSNIDDSGDTPVEVTTIDIELLPTLTALDVIKLDVEGAECDVISGAYQTIRKFRPKLIVEVHSHMDGREGNGTILTQQFNELGYVFRQIWRNTQAYYYVEAMPRE